MFLKRNEDKGFELSISDLMSGLMLVFMFISVSYMLNVKTTIDANLETQKILEAAIRANLDAQKELEEQKVELEHNKRLMFEVGRVYQNMQIDLYEDLSKEFAKDLQKWHASIDNETLSIIFLRPDALFKVGSDEIRPMFKEILRDFIPRYFNIIFSEKYVKELSEIRIEGHTSSEWGNDQYISQEDAYFKNMALSQARTRSVLKYCYDITSSKEIRDKFTKYTTANGLSSSKLLYIGENIEDKNQSRRVEFKVRLKAEEKIIEIINRVRE